MKVILIFSSAVLSLAIGFTNRCACAEEYAGARAIIEELRLRDLENVQKKGDRDEAKNELTKSIEKFIKLAPDLSPADAADEWLKLVDLLPTLPVQERDVFGESDVKHGLSVLVRVLPEPKVWPALREAIENRPVGKKTEGTRKQLLQMMIHLLLNDGKAQRRDLEQLEQSFSNQGKENRWESVYAIGELAGAMMDMASDPELSIALLLSRIESLQESAEEEMYGVLEIPDLVTIVGPERAEEILNQALRCRQPIEISVGVKTKSLARKLAVEMIDKLAVPQWQLCDTIQAVELFEALRTKFNPSHLQKKSETAVPAVPAESDDLAKLFSRLTGIGESVTDDVPYELQLAHIYYFLGLVTQGRAEEAADFLELAMGKGDNGSYWLGSAMKQMQDAGHVEAVYKFFDEMLTRDPQATYWENYISLAAETGHGDEMLAKIQAAVQTPNLKAKGRRALQRHLRSALLAVDNVDEGIALIRQELEENSDVEGLEGDEFREYQKSAIQLVQLGYLLDAPGWVEEGLRYARKSPEKPSEVSYESFGLSKQLIELLIKLDRGPEVEQHAKRLVADSLRQPDPSEWGSMGFYLNDTASQSALSALLQVYSAADRHEDVVTLLNEAPWWGVKDLAQLESSGYRTLGDGPLLNVAKAFTHTGKKEQALEIVHKVLRELSGSDPAYQLLVELEGQAAIPFLEELFQRDRFEERPLIWKARLLLDAGQVDKAEQVVKQAIAIDPSDGEQGKGDRMRAYAVLADIYQARGDDQQEDFFRRVVRAIRLAEDADDFYAAGLKSRGIAMYRESLLQFSDAYCIQSRIAVQLAEMGKLDEAAAHYQKAFELMPDSFGRVESHCFGCEEAFTGGLAQTTAERVFAQLVKNQPKKPQIHYLIGYLRNSQQRFTEAQDAYRRAVELDPDYLNAWNQILELREKIFIARELQDEATFNVLRLDPMGHHTDPPTGEVADLAQLWRVFSQHRPKPVEVSTSLYPLKASSERLEELQNLSKSADSKSQRWLDNMTTIQYSWQEQDDVPKTAGDLLSRHSVISALCTLYDELGNME